MADREDYSRTLGVVEAITVVTRQCPSGPARACAERALEAIRDGGADALGEQAHFVLGAIAGWRGDRAVQVSRSLRQFLESRRSGSED